MKLFFSCTLGLAESDGDTSMIAMGTSWVDIQERLPGQVSFSHLNEELSYPRNQKMSTATLFTSHDPIIFFNFFGSEVNLCSEETVVGEFEVRYPVMVSGCNGVCECLDKFILL